MKRKYPPGLHPETIRMTVPEIIAEFTHCRAAFPRRAVAEAIAQRDAVIPELLRILEDTASNVAEIAGQEDYMGHIFGMYLLAQFREKQAYLPLVNLASAEWKHVDLMLGDVVTEDLGRMLASVCNGDTSLICGMVENPELNEYVRSAALDALVVLVAQEVTTREEVISYFRSLFHGKLEREFSFVWTSLVSKCCKIYAGEVAEEIERAFAVGLVDTGFISPQSVRRNLAGGEEQALARLAEDPHYGFVEDTVREMADWPYFQKPAQSKAATREEFWKPASVQTTPKVGRNEPCPCGSGKKYKKCCGA